MHRPLLLSLLLLAAAPLRAQEVAPGDRVRVSIGPARHRAPTVGTVVSIDDYVLLLHEDGRDPADRLRVPLETISRFEVSRGSIDPAVGFRRGAVRGAAGGIGAVAAVIGVVSLGSGRAPSWDDEEFQRLLRRTALVTIPTGTLVGGYMGWRESERWETISTASLRPYFGPRGGQGLVLSLRF